MISPQPLYDKLDRLHAFVSRTGDDTLREWKPWLSRRQVRPSVLNLAQYLALRRKDLRKLQLDLTGWGLSSLGRCESKVMPTLEAVLANLESLTGLEPKRKRPAAAFAYGENKIKAGTRLLFGPGRHGRNARIVATLPGECAQDIAWLADLMARGMDVARINLAHDAQDVWEQMLHSLAKARKKSGRSCRILMDLGGPKIRTGAINRLTRRDKAKTGDTLWLTPSNRVPENPGDAKFSVPCTLPEVVKAVSLGQRVYIDDGTLECKVIAITGDGALLEVIRADEEGKKLKADKGINMPDTSLSIPALTEKDRGDLPFALKRADLLGYSFVQVPEDIFELHRAMGEQGYPPPRAPYLVLKIETAKAVKHFPALCVAAIGQAPAGIMIARGDLAVEIGFLRLAEMQEELLWLSEAAHIPVIWATQVLENLAKRGIPSRAEITDASMAVRASAVMLNKGPYLPAAVATLNSVLISMQAHYHHKASLLRALRSW